MAHTDDEYADFVAHPRYGQHPHFTGLNPQENYLPESEHYAFLHWHSPVGSRIANTAIVANVSRQTSATVPVTHYFDTKRQCRDCTRPFIFFAKEQQFWYEELGFRLDGDCIRCFTCRKKRRGLENARMRYEELFHVACRTIGEDREFVKCWLELVEGAIFHCSKVAQMRALLGRLFLQATDNEKRELLKLLGRLEVIATENGG